MPLKGEYAPGTSAWAREQAEAFEASGGTERATLSGKPIVVITTVGAVSGKLRKTALMRVEHDGAYAVVASRGGAAKHPKWYFNLRADPRVELQDGAVKRDYAAHEATGEERVAWWARAVKVWPAYDGYQAKTRRVIPVIVLEPVDPAPAKGDA
jgi:deazaflavin-dependent oxidoreductase (nitroreductase family)